MTRGAYGETAQRHCTGTSELIGAATPSAANNIGVLWRNEKQLKRALRWFVRAVKLGDDEANLEVGKHYLYNENDPRKAISYFQRVTPSRWVSEGGVEEAQKLTKEAKRALKSRSQPATQ